jgi:hypothetical protein
MLQEFIKETIKEENEYDDLFINPKYNNNLEFLTQFIKLELDYFKYRRMKDVEISQDDTFLRNTLPSAYASYPEVRERARKQYDLLVEKYKGMTLNLKSLKELSENISRKMKYNSDRRQQLYNAHFLRDERSHIRDDEKKNITKMINLCIENNIEIKDINLIKFRTLRNTIYSGVHISQINIKDFQEITI